MDANEIVKKFHEKIGIQQTEVGDGFYMLDVDGMPLSIIILDELNKTVLSGDLGDIPPYNRENLYKTMLESQHHFRQTNGATLAINQENDHFTLNKVLSTNDFDVDMFFSEMEQFADNMEAWKKIIEGWNNSSQGNSKEESAATGAQEEYGFIKV